MIKNTARYPKDHFDMIRPKLVKMTLQGRRVSAMAKQLKIKVSTLYSMMSRNDFSVVRIRHDHKLGLPIS